MHRTNDVLNSPAVAVLCGLEHARLDVAVVNGRLRVWPVERLTAQHEHLIQQHRDELVALVLEWLGASESPLVITWLEDLWLEVLPVNIPGSGSDEWPNWQRPMSLLLDRVVQDPGVNRILERLDAARRAASAG